jgi:hypothetical protein
MERFVGWLKNQASPGARLRPANQDAAAGSLDEVKRIVAQLRERWPEVKIVLRADSGFCHPRWFSTFTLWGTNFHLTGFNFHLMCQPTSFGGVKPAAC